MGEVKYDFKAFLTCIEQKNILLTSLLNITKQIEVQSKEEGFNLSELLSKRQTFIDRTLKCDELIKQQIKSFSEEQKSICQTIIRGDKEQALNKEQQKAFDLARKNDALAENVIAINNSAREIMEQKRNEAKINLSHARGTTSMDNLFKTK